MKLRSNLREGGPLLHFAPTLDAVTLLVIFFLLGSSFVLQSGIEVDVPTASSSLQVLPGTPVITVSAGSAVEARAVFYNDMEMTVGELELKLKEERSRTSQIIIRADELAPYGVVIKIIDAAKSEGYDVAVATSSGEEG